MAAEAILKSVKWPLTQPFLNGFAPNLKQKIKMGSQLRFVVKIHFCQNPPWQLPPFPNQSEDDNCANIEPVCTKFDRETRSQLLKHAHSAKQGYRSFSKTANIIYKKTAHNLFNVV